MAPTPQAAPPRGADLTRTQSLTSAGARLPPRANHERPMSTEASRYHEKPCATCKELFTPSGPRSRNCDSCRRGGGQEPGQRRDSHAPQLAIVADDTESPLQSAHDVVDAFALDYNLGNVVRFVLERHDGDELENLRNAHTYLERAISRLERLTSSGA